MTHVPPLQDGVPLDTEQAKAGPQPPQLFTSVSELLSQPSLKSTSQS